jgi:hypothetical protein
MHDEGQLTGEFRGPGPRNRGGLPATRPEAWRASQHAHGLPHSRGSPATRAWRDAGRLWHPLLRRLCRRESPPAQRASGHVRTRLAPLSTAPGILPASWAAAVTAGVAPAVRLRVVLLGRVPSADCLQLTRSNHIPHRVFLVHINTWKVRCPLGRIALKPRVYRNRLIPVARDLREAQPLPIRKVSGNRLRPDLLSS